MILYKQNHKYSYIHYLVHITVIFSHQAAGDGMLTRWSSGILAATVRRHSRAAEVVIGVLVPALGMRFARLMEAARVSSPLASIISA